MNHLLERLTKPGPKRILTIDGGGIRGALAVGFIEKLELMLRQRYGKPDLRLCEYFDFIGGTSTGAIIASTLSLGLSAAEIKKYYLEVGSYIFGIKRKVNNLKDWKYIWRGQQYDYQPLEKTLKEAFNDIKIGDPQIKTGLCIVAKRADTQSTWPIINHPNGKFYPLNKDILLWQVVRASTAAPGFFRPEMMQVGNNEPAVFIDGGMSMFNNPAFLLFLIATLKGFPFQWQTGDDNLLLVSVGTGMFSTKRNIKKAYNRKVLGIFKDLPAIFLNDANKLNQTILQYISNSPTPLEIDGEMGYLDNDLLTPNPALHYLRYNVKLEKDALESFGLNYPANEIYNFRKIDNIASTSELAKIGEIVADKTVLPEHFPPHFDIY